MWLHLATHYYIAARFSALAGLVPVYGNLFHHAVELYLKAVLALTLDHAQLKKRRHSLKRLWDDLKSEYPRSNLAQFDPIVAALDGFEDIRYPSETVGGTSVLDIPGEGRSNHLLFGPSPLSSAKHSVAIRDLDELVYKLMRLVVPRGRVPAALLLLTKEGHRALTQENHLASAWFPPDR